MRRLFWVLNVYCREARGSHGSAPATSLKRPIGLLIPLLVLSTQFVGTQSPAQFGALTMGFWQNKNGQAIIANGATTGGVCKSGVWLRSYAPFRDLSATADCKQVASYVLTVIKAANASGSSMNPMLKAQMLATSLDTYFSDPTLGGNSIGAPAPIGGVRVDLTRVCDKGAAACVDVSAAFGIAAPLKDASVSYLLSYASAQSNGGGSIWYGNSRSIQGLASNTFQAINNQQAFTITPTSNTTPAAIGIPVTNPSAITADVPAVVTVSSFLNARGSGAPVPTSVSLEQVDGSGGIIAILGSLNDAATNGDVSPGDQIFTGQFTFNVAAPGTVWLRVSATFTGVSDPARSASKPLEVLAPGVPLQAQYFPDSRGGRRHNWPPDAM